MRYLKVRFDVRLPDINKWAQLPEQYVDYGRLAFSSGWTISGIMSSHPPGTTEGFYWAVGHDDTLYLSPRGFSYGNWENLIPDTVIRDLTIYTGLKNKYKYFKRFYRMSS